MQDGEEDSIVDLNEMCYNILPEDEIRVSTPDKTRNLVVNKCRKPPYDNYTCSVEWYEWPSIGENDILIFLEGYGTEYILYSIRNSKKHHPTLYWPSNSYNGSFVTGINVLERESEIFSRVKSKDLYWRVKRHNGR